MLAKSVTRLILIEMCNTFKCFCHNVPLCTDKLYAVAQFNRFYVMAHCGV